MNKLLLILGPTVTRKTDLALFLAQKFNGEIVSCDSRQVYRGLDIGTGKYPSKKEKVKKGKGYWQIGGVKVWMYDVVDFTKDYSVANYLKDAGKVVEGIIKRGKLPMVVGGTGLYLKALLEPLINLAIPIDKKLRRKLSKLTVEELQAKLKSLSPGKWQQMNHSDRQNPRRLIRAAEIALTAPSRSQKLKVKSQNYDSLKIGLIAPRKMLYQKVDQRVIDRIGQGMIEEVKKLHQQGLTFKRMRQLGLEYEVLADFLQGKIKGQKELERVLQGKIHGFVRRQLTWFKKEKNVIWFDVSQTFFPKVEKLVGRWYDS